MIHFSTNLWHGAVAAAVIVALGTIADAGNPFGGFKPSFTPPKAPTFNSLKPLTHSPTKHPTPPPTSNRPTSYFPPPTNYSNRSSTTPQKPILFSQTDAGRRAQASNRPAPQTSRRNDVLDINNRHENQGHPKPMEVRAQRTLDGWGRGATKAFGY